MLWSVEDQHLMKQWEGHNKEEGTKEQVEQPFLVFPKPTKLVKHIIKVFSATLFSIGWAWLQVLWLAHGSRLAIQLLEIFTLLAIFY